VGRVAERRGTTGELVFSGNSLVDTSPLVDTKRVFFISTSPVGGYDFRALWAQWGGAIHILTRFHQGAPGRARLVPKRVSTSPVFFLLFFSRERGLPHYYFLRAGDQVVSGFAPNEACSTPEEKQIARRAEMNRQLAFVRRLGGDSLFQNDHRPKKRARLAAAGYIQKLDLSVSGECHASRFVI
jgi:hypothetical protein